MPLLSEFTNYVDWETDESRWAMMLRSRQIRMGICYFVNNMKDIETPILDNEADGFTKRKLEEKSTTRKQS